MIGTIGSDPGLRGAVIYFGVGYQHRAAPIRRLSGETASINGERAMRRRVRRRYLDARQRLL